MSERGALLHTLDRLFAGPRDTVLTLEAFLQGLQGRSYAFAVMALNLPNCVPTGIPWLSTVTGLPMLFLLGQCFAGKPVPSLPGFLGRKGLPRGKLHDLLDRIRRPLQRIENTIHPRLEWWVRGLPRRLLLIAWALVVLLLALPVPFDNLLPAWTILFFCLALIEDDGVMAMLGWLFTALTAVWTVFLVMIGHAAVMAAIVAFRGVIFG
jgi:hypothetical protein